MALGDGVFSFKDADVDEENRAKETSGDTPLPILDFGSLDVSFEIPEEQPTALDIKLQAAGRATRLVDHAVVVNDKEKMTTPELKERLREYHNHIFEGMDIHWGNPEFYSYISKLLVEFERTDRQGFKWEVNAILRELEKRHEQEFPSSSSISLKSNAWGAVKGK